jgi:hypothetical protein
MLHVKRKLLPRRRQSQPRISVEDIDPHLSSTCSIFTTASKQFRLHFSAMMLCDKCCAIFFRRFDQLSDREIVRIGRGSENHLYYFHHETLQALELAKDSCHLCRKMWDAFDREMRCNPRRTNDDFVWFSPAY